MKIDKYFHLYGRKNDVVFEEVKWTSPNETLPEDGTRVLTIELDKLRDKYGGTSQITCPKCHSEFVILPESNNALTWDELKQMVGKPVWLEDSNQQGEWVLLSGMEDDELYFVYRTCNEYKIYRKEQGTLWKAYRKERS